MGGCVNTKAVRAPGGTAVQGDNVNPEMGLDRLRDDHKKETWEQIERHFNRLREQLDAAKERARKALDHVYERKLVELKLGGPRMPEAKKKKKKKKRKKTKSSGPQITIVTSKDATPSEDEETLAGDDEVQDESQMESDRSLVVPNAEEIKQALLMARYPANNIMSERDANDMFMAEKNIKSLESKIKSLNIKIERNKKRRKRMETCAPTDLSYPVQNVLCRFSGFSMSLDNGLVQSFVEQKGPCCAAASVATCLNAILRESIESARQGSEYTQEDVMEYYRRQKPKDARLGGKRYPNTIRVSTAGVGNSLIIKALKAQAAAAGERPIVKYWLGTARKCVVKLSTSKSEKVQQRSRLFAWEKLKQFFPLDSKASAGRRREVLLNHTINHYSIIFGWREWRVESGKDKGKVVRQCLTSSYHQKPKTWMPWDTVCDIIVLSKGFYTILYFSLGEAGTDAVEDEDAAADPGADAAGTESKEKQTNEEGASPEDVDADRDTALVQQSLLKVNKQMSAIAAALGVEENDEGDDEEGAGAAEAGLPDERSDPGEEAGVAGTEIEPDAADANEVGAVVGSEDTTAA